jgi:hypothetical protein
LLARFISPAGRAGREHFLNLVIIARVCVSPSILLEDRSL